MSTIARINQRIDNLKFNYFSIMSVSLLAGTCFASMALLVVLMTEAPVWQVGLLASVAMASNAAAISHSPLRWVVWLFGLNVLTGIFLIMLSLF